MDIELKNKILNIYSEFTNVYGPYSNKNNNNRQHIILTNNSFPKKDKRYKKTVSYPKIIYELFINKKLEENETIDHIDKNPLNNNINNLQILKREEHAKLDAKRRKSLFSNCDWCGKYFQLTRNQLRKDTSGVFCSRSCSGKYGTEIQHNGLIKNDNKKEIKVEYFTLKDSNLQN